MTDKKTTWCVYQTGWREQGRIQGIGNGITSPARLLVAIHTTEAEAAREAESIERTATSHAQSQHRLHGTPVRAPILEVGEYSPLDFVGSQDRQNISGSAGRVRELDGNLRRESHAYKRALLT
jgi:hypothetical protein